MRGDSKIFEAAWLKVFSLRILHRTYSAGGTFLYICIFVYIKVLLRRVRGGCWRGGGGNSGVDKGRNRAPETEVREVLDEKEGSERGSGVRNV